MPQGIEPGTSGSRWLYNTLKEIFRFVTDYQNPMWMSSDHLAQRDADYSKKPNMINAFETTPLSSVPSLINHDIEKIKRESYDVFISHATEDKDEIARPLAKALRDKNLKVWYDEFELKIGDSLRQKIDKGVANSKFSIVVLSKSFIGKNWTNYELDGIVSKYLTGEQRLLPIWHKITKQEVIDYSPSLADKVARSTATHTVDEIAVEIAEFIKTHKSQ